mgnify:CR=1 FL=1
MTCSDDAKTLSDLWYDADRREQLGVWLRSWWVRFQGALLPLGFEIRPTTGEASLRIKAGVFNLFSSAVNWWEYFEELIFCKAWRASGNEIPCTCFTISLSALCNLSTDNIFTLAFFDLWLYLVIKHELSLNNQATVLFNFSHDEWGWMKLERKSSFARCANVRM